MVIVVPGNKGIDFGACFTKHTEPFDSSTIPLPTSVLWRSLLASSKSLETRPITVEGVGIPTLRVVAVILPDGVGTPASRDVAHAAGVPGHPQRASVTEVTAVTGALGPPVFPHC